MSVECVNGEKLGLSRSVVGKLIEKALVRYHKADHLDADFHGEIHALVRFEKGLPTVVKVNNRNFRAKDLLTEDV